MVWCLSSHSYTSDAEFEWKSWLKICFSRVLSISCWRDMQASNLNTSIICWLKGKIQLHMKSGIEKLRKFQKIFKVEINSGNGPITLHLICDKNQMQNKFTKEIQRILESKKYNTTTHFAKSLLLHCWAETREERTTAASLWAIGRNDLYNTPKTTLTNLWI